MKTKRNCLLILLTFLLSIAATAQKCHIAFLPFYITYQDSTYHFPNDTMRFNVKADKPLSKIIGKVNGVDIGVTFEYRVFIEEELQGKIHNPTTGSYVKTTYYIVRNSKMEYLPFDHFLQKVSEEKKEDLKGSSTENNFTNHKENAVSFTMSCYKL